MACSFDGFLYQDHQQAKDKNVTKFKKAGVVNWLFPKTKFQSKKITGGKTQNHFCRFLKLKIVKAVNNITELTKEIIIVGFCVKPKSLWNGTIKA